MITTSAVKVAQSFLGVTEVAGHLSNPLVLGMLQLDSRWVEDDATPWCSAFVNLICRTLGLPRSRSLAARSWLLVGTSIPLTDARAEEDIVVLRRGPDTPATGAAVITAPGHVGFYVGQTETHVSLLGGNQGNAVSVALYPKSQILSIRRLA
jgi:uncharacterized protein (TIGR02594 family)